MRIARTLHEPGYPARMPAASGDRASFWPAIERKHGLPIDHWFEEFTKVADLKYPEQIAWFRENHGFSQAHANALVMHCRGSRSARRFDSFDSFLAQFEDERRTTVEAIFDAITSKYPLLERVIAWNQPMLRLGTQYVFGVSVQARHILLGPWGVLDEFRERLEARDDCVVNKKTVQVPVDWKVNKTLLREMAGARIAQIRAEQA